MKKFFVSILTMAILLAPFRTMAIIHFGGPIQRIGKPPAITGCYGDTIFASLGPPRGGYYVWSPVVTKTYSFGPPKHAGQYLLGNAGPSYYCIESVLPLIVWSGYLILMMGSSQ